MLKSLTDKKKPHNIVVTDSTWSSVQAKSTSLNISASEYIERVLNSYDDSNLSVSDRLISDDSVVIISTLLAFTKNKSQQLGVLPKNKEDLFLIEAIVNSMVAVSLMNYAMPEFYVQEIIPPLRWLTFQYLLSKTDHKKSREEDNIFLSIQSEISSNINLIISAIAELKKYSPPQYYILKLRHIEGLTWSQITKLLKLQGQPGNESDVRLNARNVTLNLRSKYQRKPKEVKFDDEITQLENNISKNDSIARKYYELSCDFPLNKKEDINSILDIIKKTRQQSIIEFWINEIDHQISFKLDSFDEKSYLKLRKNILDKFQKTFKVKKQELDDSFETCLNREDIYSALEGAMCDQLGFEVKIKNIPFSISL